MVLTDGIVCLVEGVAEISEEFDKISSLKISIEKSTMYLVKITENVRSTRDAKAVSFQLWHSINAIFGPLAGNEETVVPQLLPSA